MLPKIIIQTDYDLTPAGARRVRQVRTLHGGSAIRGYVGGRIFRSFATAAQAIAWRDNVEKLAPQTWSAFGN